MKNFRPFLIFLFFIAFGGLVYAQYPDPNWKVIESDYPTDDVGVMTYNVKDFGAKGDGTTNDVLAFRNALNKAFADGGGVVFVPKGKYKLNNVLTIPSGVSLRGEWKKPVKGEAIEGTILMAPNPGIAIPEGKDRDVAYESMSFITMRSSSSVSHLTIWYPNQNVENPRPMPPTILYGQNGQWGNDYCNVRNVTLVNSYNGVCLARSNGGGCPNIYGLYGTPLKVGVEIDNIADVGRFEWIDFSPEYWSGSGLTNAPALSAVKDWTYENATGIVMRRNDWSYTCYVNIENYNKGFHTAHSPAGVGTAGNPNGHNYNFTFTNCKTALYCEGIAGAGIMFTGVEAKNCENGVVIADETGAIVQLYDWKINASNDAVLINENTSTKILMQQSEITSGRVNAKGGVFMPADCDFNNAAPQIVIGSNARAIITGNRFASEPDIKNNSLFRSAIDHTPLSTPRLPEFAEFKTKVTKPAKNDLFVVTEAPYNAAADGETDDTEAIKSALSAAGANGGGIVYFPAGHYKVLGNLTVPTGVEIKGTNDFGSVPKGPGSVFEVYAGKGEPNGEPFLKLSQGSGIRGMVFNYPEQMWTLYPNWPDYPYCIQATGSDVYIVNIGLRATMHGVDLFTYKCDNHYIDYLCGHVFETGIKVGAGSENGIIANTQFNTIVYASGYESKFGTWPNSPKNGEPNYSEAKDACYDYNWNKLNFLTLGNCKNQTLYNIFHYGSQRGLIFGDESGSPSGISMGTAIDASRKAVTFNSLGEGGFDMINSQIVSTTGSNTSELTTYLETTPDFTGTARLFSSDYWGGTNRPIMAFGGKLELYQAHFNAAGRVQFMYVDAAKDPSVKIFNSNIVATANLMNSNKEKHLWVESSILNHANIDTTKCDSWKNNLPVTPNLLTSTMLDRTGWIASASINNGDAQKAIDSDVYSRWNSGNQEPGKWFSVNFGKKEKFNKVVLDNSVSPNDAPSGYEVYVSNDGSNWGDPVVSGTANSELTVIGLPEEVEAQYIKIQLTASKSNYWSIHEFYLALLKDETGITPEYGTQQNVAMFIADDMLYFNGVSGESAQINIYNISGQRVLTSPAIISSINVGSLTNGVYLVEIIQDGKAYRGKVLKK